MYSPCLSSTWNNNYAIAFAFVQKLYNSNTKHRSDLIINVLKNQKLLETVQEVLQQDLLRLDCKVAKIIDETITITSMISGNENNISREEALICLKGIIKNKEPVSDKEDDQDKILIDLANKYQKIHFKKILTKNIAKEILEELGNSLINNFPLNPHHNSLEV